jgi:hypothetical protein
MTKKNKAFLCSAKKALGKKQFASQIGVSLLTRHQKNNFVVGKL